MRAKKVDTTHPAIRDHLRAIGWSVSSTAAVGDDFPDLVAANGVFAALVECKTGNRKRTQGQIDFARNWGGIVIEARTPEEAERKLRGAFDCAFCRHSETRAVNRRFKIICKLGLPGDAPSCPKFKDARKFSEAA